MWSFALEFNKKYIGETGEGKTKVQDRFQVYQQHIHQAQYHQLKCGEHFRTCRKGKFKKFPFFKLHSNNKYLREQSEKYFRDQFKSMLH